MDCPRCMEPVHGCVCDPVTDPEVFPPEIPTVSDELLEQMRVRKAHAIIDAALAEYSDDPLTRASVIFAYAANLMILFAMQEGGPGTLWRKVKTMFAFQERMTRKLLREGQTDGRFPTG